MGISKYRLVVPNYSDRPHKKCNIGDYIQAIAARRFLPSVDGFLAREEIGMYNGPPCRVIMNGWWRAWPNAQSLSPQIDPLFTSWHLHSAEDLTPAMREMLRSYEPIGCRDMETVNILAEAGIKAYFSGCLTLTLGKTYRHCPGGNEILMVDLKKPIIFDKWVRYFWDSATEYRYETGFYEYFVNKKFDFCRRLSPAYARMKWSSVGHMVPRNYTHEEYLAMADELLRRYERAALVITSRLHVALPCLGMGTPVILVRKRMDQRFSGVLPYLNYITGKGDTYREEVRLNRGGMVLNPDRHLDIAAQLTNQVEAWVAGK